MRNWLDLGDAGDAKPVLPEIARIAPSQLLCVYGDKEKDTVCPELRGSGVQIVALHGGHHLDQHPAGLATIVTTVGSSSQKARTVPWLQSMLGILVQMQRSPRRCAPRTEP